MLYGWLGLTEGVVPYWEEGVGELGDLKVRLDGTVLSLSGVPVT